MREVNFTISDKSITMTPGSFVFGSVVIPQQGIVATFTIRNIGATATTLTVGVDGQSMGTADFPIIRNTCANSVPAGGICNVDVAFRANNPPGPKHGMFTVTASDGSSLAAPLDGVAWRPAQLVLEVPATNFGSVPLLTPTALGVTVRNLGDAPSGTMNVQLSRPGLRDREQHVPADLARPAGLHPDDPLRADGARLAQRDAGGRRVTGRQSPGRHVHGRGAATAQRLAGFADLREHARRPSRGPARSSPSGTSARRRPARCTTTVSPSQFRVTGNTCASLAGAGATCNVTIQWFPTAVGTLGGSFSITGAGGWSATATLSGTGIP